MHGEIISYIKRFVGGLDTSSNKEARELINSIGPANHYLSSENTLKNFKKVWTATIMDRKNYGTWKKEGVKDYRTRLKEKTIEIAENHVSEKVLENNVNGIDKIKEEI